MRIRLIEDYLDDEEQFYDYKTGNVDGSDIFDSRHTGMSFYDQLITDPKYMEERKNLKAEIVQMTPKQYFEGCAKIFGSSYGSQVNQTQADKNNIEHLKQVIQKYNKKFPITFLNYAQNQQEGRHRMYVAGELFGWDTKFPVMIIRWADEERAKNEKEAEIIRDIEQKLHLIERDVKEYRYSNVEEVIQEIEWMADRHLGERNAKELQINPKDKVIELVYNNVTYEINLDELRFEEPSEDDEIDDEIIWDDETIAFLDKYLPGWRDRSEDEQQALMDKFS